MTMDQLGFFLYLLLALWICLVWARFAVMGHVWANKQAPMSTFRLSYWFRSTSSRTLSSFPGSEIFQFLFLDFPQIEFVLQNALAPGFCILSQCHQWSQRWQWIGFVIVKSEGEFRKKPESLKKWSCLHMPSIRIHTLYGSEKLGKYTVIPPITRRLWK